VLGDEIHLLMGCGKREPFIDMGLEGEQNNCFWLQQLMCFSKCKLYLLLKPSLVIVFIVVYNSIILKEIATMKKKYLSFST